jgi:hypothetical protein
MVFHVVGREFTCRFREEGTEYNICTKAAGHKIMVEKVTHCGTS